MAFNLLFTLTVLFLIYYYSSRDGTQTYQDSIRIARWIGRVLFGSSLSPEELAALHLHLRRLAHIILYAMLGAAAAFWVQMGHDRSARTLMTLLSGILCVAVGFADEWRKQFIPGRHYDFGDFVLNALSALAGLLLCCGLAFTVRVFIVARRNRAFRLHNQNHEEANP